MRLALIALGVQPARGLLFGLAIVVTLVRPISSAAHAATQWQTIALSGVDNQYGPNLGTGVTLGDVRAFDINSSNHVVFAGALSSSSPAPFSDAYGFWQFNGAGNSSIALSRPTGVTGPISFVTLRHFALDDTDQIVFEGKDHRPSAGDPPAPTFDIWSNRGSQNILAVDPQTHGFVGYGGVRLSNGRTVFGATGNGFSNFGLWSARADAVEAIAMPRTDGPLGPNLGPGISFNVIDSIDFQVDSAGNAVFYNQVSGGGFSNAGGIWRTSASGPRPLALVGVSGNLGPDLGDDASFTDIAPYFDRRLGAARGVDHVAFPAFFTDENVSALGVFKAVPTGNRLIALADSDGPLGPQLGPEVVFAVPYAASINKRGEVLISSNMSGLVSGSQTGLWLNSGGGNVPVARTRTDGAAGPQLGRGIEFAGIFFDYKYVDDSGQVVFGASLSGAGIDSTNNTGVWVWSNGALLPLIREGDLFDVETGSGIQQRRIDTFSLGGFAGEIDGFIRPSSSSGVIPIQIQFADGSSGIFLAQIPEPSSLVIAISAAVSALFSVILRAQPCLFRKARIATVATTTANPRVRAGSSA